jgi:hypothetical protein
VIHWTCSNWISSLTIWSFNSALLIPHATRKQHFSQTTSVIPNSGSPATILRDRTQHITLQQCQNPEDYKINLHCHKNLKFYIFIHVPSTFTLLQTVVIILYSITSTKTAHLTLTVRSASSPEFQQTLILFLSSHGLQQCSHVLWLSCIPLLHTLHHFCYALWKPKCIHVLGQLANMEVTRNVHKIFTKKLQRIRSLMKSKY